VPGAESLCVQAGDWQKCHKNIATLRRGDPGNKIYDEVRKDGNDNMINNPYYVRLIRIINGSLYYDWPWNRKQFDINAKATAIIPNYYTKFYVVMNKLSDIKDSVFFNGVEMPYLPYNFPFAALSESPSLKTMDIPVPWIKSIEEENDMYRAAFIDGKGSDVYSRHHSATYDEWTKRVNKAAFYGTLMPIRGILYTSFLKTFLYSFLSRLIVVKFIIWYTRRNNYESSLFISRTFRCRLAKRMLPMERKAFMESRIS
jgi:hypothetical protein